MSCSDPYNGAPRPPACAPTAPGSRVQSGQHGVAAGHPGPVRHRGACSARRGAPTRRHHLLRRRPQAIDRVALVATPGVMFDAPYTGADVGEGTFPPIVGAAFGNMTHIGATRPGAARATAPISDVGQRRSGGSGLGCLTWPRSPWSAGGRTHAGPTQRARADQLPPRRCARSRPERPRRAN